LLFAACTVLQPVKDRAVYHLLDPAVPERALTLSQPAIAVARPALPGYLDRQQLVTRDRAGLLQMNPDQIWGEPLDAAISRVTAQNLGRLTHSLNIQPIENFITLDYQSLLEIRVSRFEPDGAGRLVFECTWQLQSVAGRTANTRAFTTTIPIRDAGSPASRSGQAAAMSEALARLARDVARAL
jgi:uncharacterized lipoprotein YmbA